MTKKTLIIGISAIIILGLPFLYYLISRTSQPGQTEQLTDGPSAHDQDQLSEKSAEKLRETLFSGKTEETIEKFKKSRFAETKIDIPVKNENEPKPPPPVSEKTRATGGRPAPETNTALQISDAEIFNFVYSFEYLKSVSSVQD